MNENKSISKALPRLVLALIFLIAGIVLFTWISTPDMDISSISASEIAESDDAVLSDFKLLGKMGTKNINGDEYTYYIIVASDKSGNEFTMAMAVDSQTSAEFEALAQSSDTAQTVSDDFYGSISVMGQDTVTNYDSLLEQYGYSSAYPNLYYVFADSAASNPNAGLGMICLIPFLGFALFFGISFFKAINGKEN